MDDDETTLMLAEDALSSAGLRVETFNDPTRALSAVSSRQPNIIVLDVMMPGLDGFEFCGRLRSNPATADVPVMMVTSLDDPASIDRAYEVGATGFATKPLNWAIEVPRLRYMLRAAETAQMLKAKEHETRTAKEEWERTFNSISDVVTLLTPDLRVTRANSATVAAVKKPLESILGSRCHQLFQDSDVPCPDCPIIKAIQTGAPVSGEERYRNPAADCLLTGAPVKDQAGRLLHVVHIARDLTEQKQLEAEYRHAQKMEAAGTLAGGIAHEFNNLLTVIYGHAEFIRDDRSAGEELKTSAGTILQTARRGAELSKQLLTFSRKGTAKSDKRPVQCNDIVRDVQKMLQHVLPKSVTIRTHLTGDLDLINGCMDQLHQVMMNLAVNAAHAMPEKGTLTIETRNARLDSGFCHLHPEMSPGDSVILAVSDTGHGMDKQTMQRIYEPFFTTKRVGEGTGLGLSVVYGIVREHDGHIACESQVGVGTTFTIYFPALKAPAQNASAEIKPKPTARGGNEPILMVDDEAHIRIVASRALTRLGYTVVAASDGESALLRYMEGKDRIQLVVMDLGMPGMGGWECLRRLRAINPRLQVVVTTGYGGQDLPERAHKEGAVGFINKPYSLETLFRRVRELLDAQQA